MEPPACSALRAPEPLAQFPAFKSQRNPCIPAVGQNRSNRLHFPLDQSAAADTVAYPEVNFQLYW